MNWFNQLFSRRRLYGDLSDEIQEHLREKTEELVAGGMSREEAAATARREFGNVTLVQDAASERIAGEGVSASFFSVLYVHLFMDIHYGLRALRKSPGFTGVAILTLALGIGANTAIFTLLHASLWKPMPVKDPQQIFHVMRASSSGDFAGEFSYSYPLFQQLSKIAAPWGEIVATTTVRPRKFGLRDAASERIAGEGVSASFFSVLYVQPALGRVFEPHDDNLLGGNHVAVLSHAFWMRRLHSDASIVGKTIFYDEAPYTVVGVAQPGFCGMEAGVPVDVWVPATSSVDKRWVASPEMNWLRLLARLHRGADRGHSEAIIEAAFRTHVAENLMPTASPRFKQMLNDQHVTLRPAPSGLATTGRKYEKPLLVLLAVVAVVLLISCANVANLIMARNAKRKQEILVRQALGAGRGRIASQLFTESLLLALLGAACGIALAFWATRVLLSLLPVTPLPLALDLRPDFAVLGFAAVTGVATAVLFGFLPALRASGTRPSLATYASPHATGGSLGVRFLLIGQLALSLPLLVGAGLFLRTLHNLKASDLGFRPENVATFDLSFPKGTSDEHVRETYAEIKERLESHPGVIVASYASPGVYGNGGWSGTVKRAGRATPGEDDDVGLIAVGPGFFEAIGLPLLQGRYLNSQDQLEKPPVTVVNESFARHYFGQESAIGQRVQLAHEPQSVREIVGVVRDANTMACGKEHGAWRTSRFGKTGVSLSAAVFKSRC